MPRIVLDPEDVRQLPATYTATIPEDYLDSMGHMNVMWYTHLFSMGFVGMMKRLQLADIFENDKDGGSFALETHIRYLSEVRVGHTINVHARMISRSEKRFHFLYFMTNDDKQDVSATYETVGSYVSLKQRRTAPLPDMVTGEMDRLIAESDAMSWDAPVCGIMSA